MTLTLSFIIALFGIWLLFVSARLNAGGGIEIAEALLKEDSDVEIDQREDQRRALEPPPYGGERARRAAWVIGSILAAILYVIFLKFSLSSLLVAAFVGLCAGELYHSRKTDRNKKLRLKKMEYYLPTVMERIVMAVSSGLDIVPALREASYKANDPVSHLMSWIVELAESGTPVAAAFDTASKRDDVTPSVKHACAHLALAHRQGGEIVRPLKELSDATQLAYQESIEEHIARLPVKAVLPLVLTFAGLIVCFLTVPLMQVGSIMQEVASVSGR
jgi:Flp pilus assembly protein TadB